MKKWFEENAWQFVLAAIILVIMFCFPKEFEAFANAFNNSPQSPMYLPNQLNK